MTMGRAVEWFEGLTIHQRSRPFKNRFSYRVSMIDVDIDRLDEADSACRLFSVNKSNLFAFNSSEHGYRDHRSLRLWADETFKAAGFTKPADRLRLLTFPRHLLYKFAPISIWRRLDQMGRLEGIIYEVNNTFGETHAYVSKACGAVSSHAAQKELYVSPFLEISGCYIFKVRSTETMMKLAIENKCAGERSHLASLLLRRAEMTDAKLAAATLLRPFASLGVTTGIHFEALKLWLKGGKYHSRPAPPPVSMTVAHSTPALKDAK